MDAKEIKSIVDRIDDNTIGEEEKNKFLESMGWMCIENGVVGKEYVTRFDKVIQIVKKGEALYDGKNKLLNKKGIAVMIMATGKVIVLEPNFIVRVPADEMPKQMRKISKKVEEPKEEPECLPQPEERVVDSEEYDQTPAIGGESEEVLEEEEEEEEEEEKEELDEEEDVGEEAEKPDDQQEVIKPRVAGMVKTFEKRDSVKIGKVGKIGKAGLSVEPETRKQITKSFPSKKTAPNAPTRAKAATSKATSKPAKAACSDSGKGRKPRKRSESNKQFILDLLRKGVQTRESMALALIKAGLTKHTDPEKIKGYISVVLSGLETKDKIKIAKLGLGQYTVKA